MPQYVATLIVTITYNYGTCLAGQQYTFTGIIQLDNVGDIGTFSHDDRAECGAPPGSLQIIQATVTSDQLITIRGTMLGDFGHALYFDGLLVCQAPGGGSGSDAGTGNGIITEPYDFAVLYRRKHRR